MPPLVIALLLGGTVALPLSACAQPANDAANNWEEARASLVASGPGRMAPEIARWERLTGNADLNFADYANFLLANPGFPDQDRLRGYAEGRLREEFVPPEQLLAFFARYEPVTNQAKAHYALALAGVDPVAAQARAVNAWREGEMSPTAEATISAMHGDALSQADHDARMDALLWQRDREAAERQLVRTSDARRPLFEARLAILQGGDGATTDPAALTDPGYLYNRSRELRQEGRRSEAIALLTNRQPLAHLPFDQTAWVEELLTVARLADARSAQAIAASIDDAFVPGEDISRQTYKLRDDYTSLMWLGGTRALWERGASAAAAPLFYRYGAAARTPQTRSKGFYWAGYAASQAGDTAEANRYYEMAGQYGDRFYGQLALAAMGRDLPSFAGSPEGAIAPDERAAFLSAPLTAAVAEVARDAPWRTGIRFYRAIADQAETMSEHLLVAELARDIGRRDLAVNLADAAMADGHDGFTQIGYPRLDVPAGTDWTMVHAITRQESQFAENAISHAGATGLMQLMPGTAREEAGRAGIQYMSASLIDDPAYNIRLGSNHIQRLLARYDGSYPLAVAAYNAGPGNVNKWLRENGDPRTGQISWTEWIEKIGFFETKNYVQRVLENAVVYEHLYPDQAGRTRTLADFLR
ncbi:lytic transglycosylase domain-containing protein [Alteraurantiacibacter aestuarii]|nr:lytic transglycosylase domain-containing protein [Alteraurantiacibacter aestuarii]